MGRFSTTLNIKNNSDREGFLKSFCEMMKKRGFVQCNEDEGVLSYALAFGDGWVTLSNENYTNDPRKAYDDRKLISEEMKTAAFTVEVVDSDFAILCLNSNGRTSKIVVGDGEGYGVEKSPFEVEDWKPLIKNGDSEKFLETVGQDNVFAEKTLSVIAELLGIDPYYMDADYDEVLEKSDDKNVTVFYFKEGAVKAMSLNTAFKKVFGAALEPLGFKLIKSKYPYFVRVVPGGEIIHIISYMEEWYPFPDKKQFNVISGIATVYRHKIDLSISPKDNCNWLYTIDRFYWRTTPQSELDNEFRLSICHFMVDENGGISMHDAMKYSLELSKRFILSQLNTAIDLKSSLAYLKRLGQSRDTANFDSKLNFSGCGNSSEGLLYVKVDDEEFKTILKNMINGTTPCDDEDRQRATEKYKFFNDPIIHEKVLAELERRKAQNTEILRSYGLDI